LFRRLAPVIAAATEVEHQAGDPAPVVAAAVEVEHQASDPAPMIAAAVEVEHQVGELVPAIVAAAQVGEVVDRGRAVPLLHLIARDLLDAIGDRAEQEQFADGRAATDALLVAGEWSATTRRPPGRWCADLRRRIVRAGQHEDRLGRQRVTLPPMIYEHVRTRPRPRG
jgi:hypothetical protein